MNITKVNPIRSVEVHPLSPKKAPFNRVLGPSDDDSIMNSHDISDEVNYQELDRIGQTINVKTNEGFRRSMTLAEDKNHIKIFIDRWWKTNITKEEEIVLPKPAMADKDAEPEIIYK